jgi:hypothetical protein
MRALAFGIVAAALLAGPKLYGLVGDGSMSGDTAVLRGGLLAVACAVGFALVASIGAAYSRPAEDAAEDDEDAQSAQGGAAAADDRERR